MALTLDPKLEERIQQKIARGHYREPAEVLDHALNLIDAEEDWLLRNRDAINERLEESFAQVGHGDVYTPEEVRAHLASVRVSSTR